MSKPETVALVIRAEAGPYWLELEADPGARLADLDAVLRRTWLECCGHLSGFRIGEQTHGFPPDLDCEVGGGQLRARIGDVLSPGDTAEYEYDFGSTTHLKIEITGERKTASAGAVRIVGRNEAPDHACEQCGAPATRICPFCAHPAEPWSEGPFLCETHAAEHPCAEDLDELSPVVNSPRMGVCGYGLVA